MRAWLPAPFGMVKIEARSTIIGAFSAWLIPASMVAAAEIDFAHEIAPVLREHCAECHLESKKKGGFSMNTREDLLAGSENGGVLEPGKGSESIFIELLTTEEVDIQMPPKGDRLSAQKVALLQRWIDEGAKWEPGFTFGEAGWEPPLAPRQVSLPEAIEEGRDHPLDRLLDHYLAEHDRQAGTQVDDAGLIRRLYLDLIGLLPTPTEVDDFVSDQSPDKREKLIDEILGRDVDYAEHWLSFWNDLLRNDYVGTGYIDGGRKQITSWLYRSLVDNKPYDQFVRELVAPGADAEGFINGIKWRGKVNASQTREVQFAQNISQVFLGINMKCASCHDSFIDRWKLEEAYGLAAIFATEPVEIHRCDKATGKMAKAAWIFPELGEIDPEASQAERLKTLASLMTDEGNGRFSRTLVNRIWHRMMGRGIVHPVDAMHTRPWSEDLLDWLAVDFTDSDYDLKKLIRRIATSRAYQSVMAPTPDAAVGEEYIYEGPIARRMTAEQFIDAVWRLTATMPGAANADLMRVKFEPGQFDGMDLKGKWIWSNTGGIPAAGEKISLRKTFELKARPQVARAVVSADNAFTLYLNGRKLAADDNWNNVAAIDLRPALKTGNNVIVIAARNGGTTPNAAGVFFDARLKVAGAEAAEIRIASDLTWQWTRSQPDGRGVFAKPVEDWQVVAAQSGPWMDAIAEPARVGLARADQLEEPPVRAALVKSDLLMRALGRPNREQVVTVRPEGLSTLLAIDLANGDILASLLSRGAENRAKAGKGKDPHAVISGLFHEALSRSPTEDEIEVLSDLAGAEITARGMEDVLWALLMLPEFQLVR